MHPIGGMANVDQIRSEACCVSALLSAGGLCGVRKVPGAAWAHAHAVSATGWLLLVLWLLVGCGMQNARVVPPVCFSLCGVLGSGRTHCAALHETGWSAVGCGAAVWVWVCCSPCAACRDF